ncbi:MAG: hypothetical protein LBL46_02110 [Rickettsiales bacterium]|nr:hypothetical protein [Rickettsiales bacterium]
MIIYEHGQSIGRGNYRAKSIQTEIIERVLNFCHIDSKKLSLPSTDYPEISSDSELLANNILAFLVSKYMMIPMRIGPSIEGGIAITYRKNNDYKKEVFIEAYNGGAGVISYFDEKINKRVVHEFDKLGKIVDHNKMFERFSPKKTIA